MKRIVMLPILLLCISWSTMPVEWVSVSKENFKEVCDKMKEFYTGKTRYSLNLLYTTHEGHDKKEIYDKTTGYLRKYDTFFHLYVKGIHTIQNNKFRFVIDSAEQTIMVSDPDKDDPDYMQFKFEVSQNHTKGYYSKKENGHNFYKIQYDGQLPYTAYIFSLNDDGSLRSNSILYGAQYPTDYRNPNSQKFQPRLDIEFSEFKTKIDFDPSKEFNEGNYFTEQKGKLKLKEKYVAYKLLDNRASKLLKSK